MADKVERSNANSIKFIPNASAVEEHMDDNGFLYESTLNISDTNLKNNNINQYETIKSEDNIKMELSSSELLNNSIINAKADVSTFNNIKIEFDNGLLFCERCQAYCEDYCTTCDMLLQILNKNDVNITDNGGIADEMPSDIFNIENSFERVGIFAQKVIPKGVKLGPFNGISLEGSQKLKAGKFVMSKDELKLLNWMQYINPARSTFEQNLVPFQLDDNLYYRSSCQIQNGEELLVYFGAEYEDSLYKEIEMDFSPTTEKDDKDVFACIFCCLGFSSRTYLAKHKSVCPHETNEEFSIEELMQCPVCKIYMWKEEYSKYHMAYCHERNVRKRSPLMLKNNVEYTNKCKTRQYPTYKCTLCKYRTKYKGDLKNHINKHYDVRKYKCRICSRRFRINKYLIVHMKTHNGVKKEIHKDIPRKITRT